MDFVNVDFEAKKRDYATGPRGPRERTAEQKPWDAAFEKAMAGNGILGVQVPPEQADEVRKRVASAARLYGRAVTEGVARPGKVEGTVILAWKIRIPQKREKKAESSGK